MEFLKEKSKIKLQDTDIHPLNNLSNDEVKLSLDGKGWNINNIYNLELLRDLYLAIYLSDNKTKESIFNFLLQNNRFIKATGLKDKERYIYEYINALKCYRLIDYSNSNFTIIRDSYFNPNNFNNSDLAEDDIEPLKEIFFNYIRFKDVQNWFLKSERKSVEEISAIKEDFLKLHSTPLFCSSLEAKKDDKTGKNRSLNDLFFYSLNSNQYYKLEDDAIARFLDVFVNWGQKLGLIEKINLSSGVNIELDFKSINRNISVVYFLSKEDKVNVVDFINENYAGKTKLIHLPELVVNLCVKHRASVEDIKNIIQDQCFAYNENYSIQRTSEIFIKGKERLYPKFNNSYVSHLLLR